MYPNTLLTGFITPLVKALHKEICHRVEQLARMRVELDAFDGGLGFGGQVQRVGVGEIDRAGLLEDLHGACKLRGVLGARGKDCLDLVVITLV